MMICSLAFISGPRRPYTALTTPAGVDRSRRDGALPERREREPVLEVRDRAAHRALDRGSEHRAVHPSTPPGTRLELDRQPVVELAVGLGEVPLVTRVRKPALDARVLD
jgi:hypothetical protein